MQVSRVNHVSKAHFEQIKALRCEAAMVSGELDVAARPEFSGMALFYCQQHQTHHAYSIARFHLLADEATNVLAQQNIDELAPQGGANFHVEVQNLISSKARTLSNIDKQHHIDNHRRVQAEDKTARLSGIVEQFGFDPRLLDEYYTCYRKIAHPTPQHARQHLNRLVSDKGDSGVMETYQCSYCTGWHVGHLSRVSAGGRGILDRRVRSIKLLQRGGPTVSDFCVEKQISIAT